MQAPIPSPNRREVSSAPFSALLLAPVLILCGLSASSQAQLFGPATAFNPGGVSPESIVVGDLNNDGALDIAVANFSSFSNNVRVLLGDGVGGFTLQAAAYPAGTAPSSLAIGDLNSDGALDLAVGHGDFNTNTVSILLGNGTGGFAPQFTVATGGFPSHVVMADMNGDTAMDLVVANITGNTISVLLGNGAGGFAPQQVASSGTITAPLWIAVGDMNNDGNQDVGILALKNLGGFGNFVTQVSILQGNGAGGLSQLSLFTDPSGDSSPESLAIGDLNSDGNLDVALSGPTPLLLGDGAGGFSVPIIHGFGFGFRSVVIDDVNGDGFLDLLDVSGFSSSTVQVKLGDGAGGFAPQQDFPLLGLNPFQMALGDFNGDGAPDIVTVSTDGNGSNMINVLLNQTPNCTASPDLNADGFVNSSDLATLLTQWGTAGTADLNCDNIVNSADLAKLLTNWG